MTSDPRASFGYITIPVAEFAALEEDSKKLARLEAGGVDNWDGYETAMSEDHDNG